MSSSVRSPQLFLLCWMRSGGSDIDPPVPSGSTGTGIVYSVYSGAGVGKMISFTILGFLTTCGTILGTVNEL